MKKTSFTVIGLALVGVLVLFFSRNLAWGEYKTGYGPGFYPRILVIVLFILLAILFIQDWIKLKGQKEPAPVLELKYSLIFLGMMILYTVLLNILGFFVDTALFLVAGMVTLKAKVMKAIVVSLVVSAALYYSFGVLLLVQLPKGLLFGG